MFNFIFFNILFFEHFTGQKKKNGQKSLDSMSQSLDSMIILFFFTSSTSKNA